LVRKFGKKRYMLQGGYPTKAKAVKAAQVRRKYGISARVVRSGRKEPKWKWALYVEIFKKVRGQKRDYPPKNR